MELKVNIAGSSHGFNTDVSFSLSQENLRGCFILSYSCANSRNSITSTYIIQCFNSKQVCLTCVRCCYVSSLPPNCLPSLQAVQQSTLIGVNVFKFSLQLSGRFILPVVTANGCITRGSGHDPRGISRVGGGHLRRLTREADPPCQP